MKYLYEYLDRGLVPHQIVVEADDEDQALELALAEFYRREPLK